MIEMIKGKLVTSVQQSIVNIDKTIEAIEKTLKKLLVFRDTEIRIADIFDGGSLECKANSSVDVKINSLEELREELIAEKEQNLLLLNNLDSLLHGDGAYPASTKSGSKMVCVIVEPLSEQANRCEETARRLSCNAGKYSSKVKGILDDDKYASEAVSEILRYIDEYEVTTCELMNLCQEASNAFRRMRDSYAMCEDSSMHNVRAMKSFDEMQEKNDIPVKSKQLPIPPPILPSCAMASVSHAWQSETKNKPEVKHSNDKKVFLGLFKRKKKNEVATSEESVIPPPHVDRVQFSAVAPGKVIPGRYLPISIVMYEDAFRKAVDDIIRSHGENEKESKSGYQDVERNSLIRVVLASPDVTIEDSVEEKKWNGNYLNFEFAIKIPNDFAEEQILLSANVYVNDIIATKLKLILDCERESRRNIGVTREDIVSAFVSYASQDRNRVAAIIQGMKKARPDMDIFFDIESLRSGQKWEEALKSEISNRDILFLCWSRHARDSKWVDMEWRYALESKGEDGIEPIPIDSPDICPPPVELQQKHFNDKMLFIIKATMPAEVGHPYLMRIKTNECMTIDKPIVRIGKEEKYVDLMISGNDAVSRSHANIISREGKYYIVDLNSTNRTFVDGQVIPANVEIPIKHGSKIKLANEEFEFVYSSCVYGGL